MGDLELSAGPIAKAPILSNQNDEPPRLRLLDANYEVRLTWHVTAQIVVVVTSQKFGEILG